MERPKHESEEGLVVLFVDDDDLLRELYEDVLRTLGHEIFLAQNGQEAIRVFEAHSERIHVAIVDINLPDMTGFDIAKHFRSRDPGAKVILTSGDPIDDRRESLEKLGVADFILKPFSYSTLTEKLGEVR